jgi:hypothetical protein
MKKYTLPFVILLLALQVGCKDENQSLPEQGHNGPTIDVQKDMKTSPQVKDHTE